MKTFLLYFLYFQYFINIILIFYSIIKINVNKKYRMFKVSNWIYVLGIIISLLVNTIFTMCEIVNNTIIESNNIHFYFAVVLCTTLWSISNLNLWLCSQYYFYIDKDKYIFHTFLFKKVIIYFVDINKSSSYYATIKSNFSHGYYLVIKTKDNKCFKIQFDFILFEGNFPLWKETAISHKYNKINTKKDHRKICCCNN